MFCYHDEVKISLFKLGLGLLIAGMIWISFIFDESEKANDSILLKQHSSFALKLGFTGEDIGFYKIYMPKFSGEEVFVQILDSKDNVIEEEKIQTKLSVGYFDFKENGIHTVKITNISKNPIELQVELGDTNSKEMVPAGILTLVGALTIIMMSYVKIRNYSMEQPDENIS